MIGVITYRLQDLFFVFTAKGSPKEGGQRRSKENDRSATFGGQDQEPSAKFVRWDEEKIVCGNSPHRGIQGKFWV